jgi:acyl-CoA synthetase (AMP-forming)/AMP-acid ligase II
VALKWRDERWTYGQLRAAVDIVRRGLRGRPLVAGSRIALLLRNSPQYTAAYYGVIAGGFVVVPLNNHERATTLAGQIRDSGANLLIGDRNHPEWHGLADELRGQPIELIGLQLDGGKELSSELEPAFGATASAASADGAEPVPAPDRLASIIYTSGTTGRPKGVMLSHRNLYTNATAVIASLGLTAEDNSLCVLPFFFSYGNSVLHSHLACGACLTLEDNFAYPHIILQRMQDERVSGFAGVPSTFSLLLARHRLRGFDLGRLRYVTQAGGPMPRPLLAELRAQLPFVNVFLMYGQTEATARLTCLPPKDLDRKPGSVGLPVSGVDIEIRDGGTPVPRRQVGEIFARGPGVMLGYWHDPAASAEVLRDGWLCTRDLGYLDEEGYLYITGRATDMIKIGAFRVSPQEIEEVIAGLEGVQDAGVAGIPDDVLGQAVKAVVVPRPGVTLTAMAVKAYCRRYLAGYKVPKVVEFAGALPRTASGKVQRFKLAQGRPLHDA